MTTIQLFLLRSEIGFSFLHFVILTNLIFLFSCRSTNFYNSDRMSKITVISYELANKKINEKKINSLFLKDSILFLNPSICNLLSNNYSESAVINKILLSCQNLDQIYESKNDAKHIVSELADSINQLHYWDQKVRKEYLQLESNNPAKILNRSVIDSIDSVSLVYSGQTEPPIPVETEPLCFVI